MAYPTAAQTAVFRKHLAIGLGLALAGGAAWRVGVYDRAKNSFDRYYNRK
jgi:hypothetical protein